MVLGKCAIDFASKDNIVFAVTPTLVYVTLRSYDYCSVTVFISQQTESYINSCLIKLNTSHQ